jgi:DNA-binding XRE family transcriptional regulator
MNNKLREVRKDIGMSVSELARRANTSRQTITKIELHGQEPSGVLMLAIANALKIDPREIFFTTDVIQDLQKSNTA